MKVIKANQVVSVDRHRCNNHVPTYISKLNNHATIVPNNCDTVASEVLLALTSAKFPHFAKCAVIVAPTPPAITPHNALETPLKHNKGNR